MIASLRGVLRAVQDGQIVVEVGDIGFAIHITDTLQRRLPELGQNIELHTHMVVRDDDILIYGFETAEQSELFQTLLSAPRIGPRTALALISSFSPEALHSIISSGDVDALTHTPGIGRKTAERLLLDLRGKLGGNQPASITPPVTALPQDGEVMEALIALGYSQAEAQMAVANIAQEVTDLDARILQALRILGSR